MVYYVYHNGYPYMLYFTFMNLPPQWLESFVPKEKT